MATPQAVSVEYVEPAPVETTNAQEQHVEADTCAAAVQYDDGLGLEEYAQAVGTEGAEEANGEVYVDLVATAPEEEAPGPLSPVRCIQSVVCYFALAQIHTQIPPADTPGAIYTPPTQIQDASLASDGATTTAVKYETAEGHTVITTST